MILLNAAAAAAAVAGVAAQPNVVHQEV